MCSIRFYCDSHRFSIEIIKLERLQTFLRSPKPKNHELIQNSSLIHKPVAAAWIALSILLLAPTTLSNPKCMQGSDAREPTMSTAAASRCYFHCCCHRSSCSLGSLCPREIRVGAMEVNLKKMRISSLAQARQLVPLHHPFLVLGRVHGPLWEPVQGLH